MVQGVHITYKEYLITTKKECMYPADVHRWLSETSYWAKGIPYPTFITCFENSFVMGVIAEGKQIGFARLVTDYATFAYLADVFIVEEHRGKGISKVMMHELFNLDWVKGLRRLMLATKDAHELYKQVGFHGSKFPDRIMEITRPDIYGDLETRC